MGKIRNWARWSEMLVIIFPAIRLSDGSVEKILSINVFDLGLIHVGKVIWDMKKLENIYIYIYIYIYTKSKKFAESLFLSFFNKSILKLPNSSISFLVLLIIVYLIQIGITYCICEVTCWGVYKCSQ